MGAYFEFENSVPLEPRREIGGLNLSTKPTNPVTQVDPSGLEPGDLSEPWAPMFEEYDPFDADGWNRVLREFQKFRKGEPMETHYGPETQATRDMQTDTGRLLRGLHDWTRTNRANRHDDPSCPLVRTRYFPDKSWGANLGFIEAGLNPTRQFVGGYSVVFTPTGNGYLKVDVVNVTSNNSYKLHVGKNNPNGSAGPLRNQTQHYYWHIKIDDDWFQSGNCQD